MVIISTVLDPFANFKLVVDGIIDRGSRKASGVPSFLGSSCEVLKGC